MFGYMIELLIEHLDDFGTFVIDYSLGLFIPQNLYQTKHEHTTLQQKMGTPQIP